MLNTEDFVKRLDLLLAHFSLSAASFSDTIGIQRSSVSHLLAGRNKPSLDFILKIVAAFPQVDLYWLLEGKGAMLRKNNDSGSSPVADSTTEKIIIFHSDGTFSQYKPRKE